jgi:hypothetical protein
MVRNREVVIGACLVAAALMMGCGSSSSGTNPAAGKSNGAEPGAAAEGITTAINPCTLLTRADAKQILGAPVTEGKITSEVGMAPGTRCSYLTSAPIETAGGTWGVSVEVYDQSTFNARGSYFKSPAIYFQRNHDATKASPHTELMDVKGVGTAAYWTGLGLHVLDRGVYLVITVHANFHIPPGPGEKVRAEEDAAELHAATNVANTLILPRLEKLN